MKKMKRAAAKKWPNERALRERVRLRDHVRSIVIEIRRTWDWIDRAIEALEGSDAERFCMEQVKALWLVVGHRTNYGSPAIMRPVVDALDGKSLLSKRDEELLVAYAKAKRAGKRQAQRTEGEYNIVDFPFPSEVADALPAKRKGTKPLTPKEKQTIRELEWSGCSHTVIEHDIRKSYKHTDSGDIVEVNENGDAPLAKGTLKRKKRNKEAMSRRLKVLGRPLSEKPGAPRKRP